MFAPEFTTAPRHRRRTPRPGAELAKTLLTIMFPTRPLRVLKRTQTFSAHCQHAPTKRGIGAGTAAGAARAGTLEEGAVAL